MLMPTRSPRALTRAPPELPSLMAASVCSRSCLPLLSGPMLERPIRPVALMMPLGDGLADVVGLPMASTTSPRPADAPGPAGSPAGCPIRWQSTARSVSLSVPTSSGTEYPPIPQGDDDLVRIGDDVIVGEHVAALVHDDAGPSPWGLSSGLSPRLPAKAAGVDVDDGRAGTMGGVGETQLAGIGDEARQGRRRENAGKHQQQSAATARPKPTDLPGN